jgi:hypothetical protein
VAAYPQVSERAPAWWREHWLQSSEGFRVEHAGELLGFVEEVECSDDGLCALLIESCAGGPAHVLVSEADIVDVDPHRCLITLRARED